jgi:5-oxoprolinase (ATP-hydrolysing)
VRNPVQRSQAATVNSVYFDKVGRVPDTPVFLLEQLRVGDEVTGPAMIIDDTQTIVVVPEAKAVLCSKHLYVTLA